MLAGSDQARDVGHVDHEIRTDLVGDLAEGGEIKRARIRAGARDDQLRLVLVRGLADVLHVDRAGLGRDAVVHEVVVLARRVDRMAVREVAAVVKAQRKHRVAGRQEREVRGHVGLRAGVRLDVGVLGAVEALGALNRQCLDLIDDVAAAVVALTWIALGVLIGGDAAHRLHDRRPREVLRGDQLELVALAVQLAVEEGRDRGIDCFESSGAEGVEGEIVDGHAAECTRGVDSGKHHQPLSIR